LTYVFDPKPDLPTASRLVKSFMATIPKDCDFLEQKAMRWGRGGAALRQRCGWCEIAATLSTIKV